MSERDVEWAAQMRASLSGDVAAYRAVLASLTIFLRGEVRRGFARYGNGGADAEDVVQETLLAIHLKRETWRTDEPLIPWVRAIARNKLIDSLRRGGRRINVPIDDYENVLAAPEPSQHLSEKDATEVLSQLKGRQRDIVEAISLNGASIRETATKFNVTEGAVRVALHRGLSTLAKAFRTEDQ
ncbi:MAG: sigma-70 family RNA polymerase sigma factor [Hyphomicrobium aestuarii]|nr:sigma-70 family RNA polymerase sigma factor [Hyphomicrobium aestuarii]